MKVEDGRTQSIWSDVRSPVPHSAPSNTDVVVVGGGIAGLTAAYLLAGEGRAVLLADEGDVGRGQTERTSAHLASILDDHFAEVEKMRGLDVAKLAYQSHADAIDLIEKIARDENIDCDFARVDAYLFDGPEPQDVKLQDEYAACQRVGVAGLSWADAPVGTRFTRGIKFAHQAVFHPTKYCAGLAKACQARGVKFALGRRVTDASGKTDDAPPTVTFDDGDVKVTCQAIVVATNPPSVINDWLSVYLKQAAYRTYMVGHAVPDGTIADALYWDTHDPYHYSRLTKHDGRTVLLTGGEDHKTGQDGMSDDRFAELSKWAKEHFPSIGEEVTRWSGQVNEPSDGLGILGVAPTAGEHVYVITGDSGMGLTHGTLGAKLVTDLIAGRDNPYTAVYDPNRFLMGRAEAVKENLNANKQYLDWVTGGDIASPDALAPGEGGLMRSGLKKLAVYKDEQGHVHQCTAVCPHLQGILQWNPVEKTWDCPVHGSRFACAGELLTGPAIHDLSKVD